VVIAVDTNGRITKLYNSEKYGECRRGDQGKQQRILHSF
jgi:hypothetical protein